MDFTDYFLNQGWVYLNNIDLKLRKKIENICSAETIAFDKGISLINEEYSSSTMLIFKFNDGFILGGKYPFLSLKYSVKSARILSLKKLELYYFAQDIWSSFYFFLVAKNENVERYVLKNDNESSEFGMALPEEESIKYGQYADFILTLSENKIGDFDAVESSLKEDNMNVRTVDFESLLQV